jgi:hypothetical protein
MKWIGTLVVAGAAAALAAPAYAEDPLPPPDANIWPGTQVPVAFYVDTVTASPNESIYGAWAPTRCTQTNFFGRREGVVFHIAAVDTKTGKVVTSRDVKYAYVAIPGEKPVKLRFTPHGRDPKTAPWYWAARWDVRPDYPLGVVDFTVVFKLKRMKAAGEVATWKQYPVALAQLTIIDRR